MVDVVIKAPSREALDAYAQTLGAPFWSDNGIVPTGPLPGGGSYFVNFCRDMVPTGRTVLSPRGEPVPEYAELDGCWVRVVMNGPNLFALGALPMPPEAITVYMPTNYPGMPEGYVQPPYGMIA